MREPVHFDTQIKVRFADCDRAGIAYYPNMVDYLHTAMEDFFEGFVGRPYAKVLEEDNLGFPAVKLDVSFQRPLRLGEVITIRITVSRLGNSSLRFHYRLLGPAGDQRAEAHVTVVCVAIDSLHPRRIPASYREALERCREDEG